MEFFSYFDLPSTIVLSNFKVISSHEIQVRTPGLVPGSYIVSVDNEYGNSTMYFAAPPGEFSLPYQTEPYTSTVVAVVDPGGAAITGSSGDSCSVTGGCTMTLTGVSLGAQSAMTAYVGEQQATIVSDVNDTVTITVPPAFLGLEGTVDVFLTTAHGPTADTLDALLTYY